MCKIMRKIKSDIIFLKLIINLTFLKIILRIVVGELKIKKY